MTKTRFGSQRVILDISKQQIEEQNNGTREPPPPFMENSIKNFHFVFLILPLVSSTSCDTTKYQDLHSILHAKDHFWKSD